MGKLKARLPLVSLIVLAGMAAPALGQNTRPDAGTATGGVVEGQAPQPVAGSDTVPGGPVTVPTAAADAGAPALGEIVITAQRRAESAQKTPLVVNVLSGADLVRSGASDVQRLGELVPSVHVVQSNLGGAQIGIRGIVNNNVNVGSDPSLALSTDDIYIARAQAALSSFYDIARVEVLKGPQGTLYGRNSISGALNIITADPSFEWTGRLSATFGNYAARNIEGALNAPIGDRLAVRVSGQIVRHDGYIDSYWNNQDNSGARVKVLGKITDTLRISLLGSYARLHSVGQLNPIYPFTSDDPWHPHDATVRNVSNLDNSVYTAAGKLVWETKPATLTYIHAYVRFKEDDTEAPSFPLQKLRRTGLSEQDTDEVRLTSTSRADAAGHLSWVAGFFSYRETQTQFRHVEALLPQGQLVQDAGYPRVYADSIAGFGQGTFAVLDALRVTGGVRVTRERKNATGSNDTTLAGRFMSVPTQFNYRRTAVTYKGGVEFDLAPRSLVYASVTSGFHGGGWQDGSSPVDNTYQPEKLTSYEVGTKNEFLDRRLRLNTGFYYYDYRNFLVGVQDALAPTCACFTNAPKARAYGVETEIDFALTPADRFGIDFAYEKADYTDFQVFYPFVSTVPGGVAIPASGGRPAGQDYSGTAFPYVSRWSGNLSYQHTFTLANGARIVAQVQSQFRTKYGATLGNVPVYQQPGFTKTDLNLSYQARRYWTISGFLRNIEKSPAVYSLATAVGGGPPLRVGIATPRTYGVRLDASF